MGRTPQSNLFADRKDGLDGGVGADDIRFIGFIAKANGLPMPQQKSWQMVTARVQAEERKQYKGVGPVLYTLAMEEAEEPEEEVVTFN